MNDHIMLKTFIPEISAMMVPRRSAADRCRKDGFSLVEVTLALMVVAVGILSVMSLFPAGLDQNVRSIADTRMAFFAEDVFNGLQAWAQDDWDGLDQAVIPVAAEECWATNAMPLNLVEYYPGQRFKPWPVVWTNAYYLPADAAGNPLAQGEKYHMRFSFAMTTNNPRDTIKGVTLFVWSGEFGTTNNPTIFYSEFFKNQP